MKNRFIQKAILLITTVFIITAFSADNEKENVLMKTNHFFQQFPQEKIYLHTDRPSYWANEDIWFKAYLKNIPIKTCNLYVELINSKGKVVHKNTSWAKNGLSYGNLHLTDTLTSGVYQLRAYTSWMRNFDEQYFFRKDLAIWNLRDKNIITDSKELKSRDLDFQFMPEGGTFVAGINNRVAFKVIDKYGKGLDIKGVILDEKGSEIVKIKSGHKGMGSFELTPEAGKKYTAEVLVAGNINMNINLPEAAVSGVAMKINPEETDRLHIEINESGLPSAGKYLIVGQVEGKISYQKEVLTNSEKGVLDIDKNDFPTGIVRLTLFDGQMIPRCERLVFVNHNDQIEVKIEPEKTEFHPREKMIFDLSTLEKDETPVFANLSFSAYMTETTPETEPYPENIMTRFLLSSELKGRVEAPAYYFKDDSISTIRALDNLLLTHGYRYFGWEEITDNRQPEISWQPDTSIELKGKVVSIWSDRAVPGSKVSMMTLKSLLDVREQVADSAGIFVIPNLYFFDTLQVSLQSRNPNGKINTEIRLDKRVTTSPETDILPLNYQYNMESQSTTITFLSELSPELRNKKWHVSDTILLGDINVVTRKKKKEYDGFVRPYLEADYVIDVTLIENSYGTITETLEMNSALYRMFMNRGPRAFLDGSPDVNGAIESMPASWIDKVELVKMAPIPGAGFGPAAFFFTKRGAPNKIPKFASGISTTKLVGYSVIRNFYSPVYDGSEDAENLKGDLRSTLYWNPVIETDEDGVGWVSFYNSDQIGEVKVVVEGVTKTGKLCRGVYTYSITP